jgi:hypothetical protein
VCVRTPVLVIGVHCRSPDYLCTRITTARLPSPMCSPHASLPHISRVLCAAHMHHYRTSPESYVQPTCICLIETSRCNSSSFPSLSSQNKPKFHIHLLTTHPLPAHLIHYDHTPTTCTSGPLRPHPLYLHAARVSLLMEMDCFPLYWEARMR